MNEELAQLCFETFHKTWKQHNRAHEHLPFDALTNENKEVWGKVGTAAIEWFLDMDEG